MSERSAWDGYQKRAVEIQKNNVIAIWRKGAGDTLVKVASRAIPVPDHNDVGFCTTLKYVVGRDPQEIELIVGYKIGTKLRDGADIFRVDPLPSCDQFEFKGYSYLPAGVPQINGKVVNELYPPGEGAPQWRLVNYPWSSLKKIATILPGEKFKCRYDSLPSNSPAYI